MQVRAKTLSTLELPVAKLRWERDPTYLSFRCQDDLIPLRAEVIQAAEERSSRIAQYIGELTRRGVGSIAAHSNEVGQVNGLVMCSTGDIAFGRPTRITARTSLVRGGIVSIQRQPAVSGKMHDKDVQILCDYLSARYAQNRPLGISAVVAFEQSYDEIDGNRASSAELYAILSSLAAVPLRQHLAVTGSVDQNGDVQAIGRVNQEIEGFFDFCKIAGLNVEPGVIIPRKNAENLMLREDVVEAVTRGTFHIYAVNTVDEGIEILSGMAVGQRGPNGRFPEGTVGSLVQQRFDQYVDEPRPAANRPSALSVAGRASDHEGFWVGCGVCEHFDGTVCVLPGVNPPRGARGQRCRFRPRGPIMIATSRGPAARAELSESRLITIRRYGPADENGLIQFFERLPEEAQHYLRCGLETEDGLAKLLEHVTLADNVAVVALHAGDISGCALLDQTSSPGPDPAGKLFVVIDPGYWDLGLGIGMIREVIEGALNKGVRNIIFHAVEGAEEAAIEAARRLGFARAGLINGGAKDISGEQRDIIVLALPLDRDRVWWRV